MKDMKAKSKISYVRIIPLGDACSGKTCLMERYFNNTFSSIHLSTMGIDSRMKFIKMENGEKIKVILTDISDRESNRSLSSNFISKSDGIILLYDITEESSFNGAKNWLKSIREEYGDTKPIILVGNKIDLEEKRKVNKKEGELFAKENNLKFYECSCKTGENVEKIVDDLIGTIYPKYREEILKKEKKEK